MLLPFVNPNDTDFPPDVVKHFESGMHGDELMIPWHDKDGNLLAHLMRGPGVPRGTHDRWEGEKPRQLYNLHRIKSDAIVLTQDVYDVWHAYMGHHDAVAFHGRWLMGYADDLEEAGVRFVSLWMPPAPSIVEELAYRFFVRYVEIPIRTERHWNGGASL